MGEGRAGAGGASKRPAGVRLSVSLPRDPQIAALSDGAWRLYVTAICWAVEHRSDGFVPLEVCWDCAKTPQRRRRILAELTGGNVPLFAGAENGYIVRGFLEYQYSRDQARKHKDAGNLRKARQRARSRGHGVTPEPANMQETPESHAGTGEVGHGGTGEDVTAGVTGKKERETLRSLSFLETLAGAGDLLGPGEAGALVAARPRIRELLDQAARSGDASLLGEVHRDGTRAERELADRLAEALEPEPPTTDGWNP